MNVQALKNKFIGINPVNEPEATEFKADAIGRFSILNEIIKRLELVSIRAYEIAIRQFVFPKKIDPSFQADLLVTRPKLSRCFDFQIVVSPLGARTFSAFVGLKGIDDPPFSRHFPRRKFTEQKLL